MSGTQPPVHQEEKGNKCLSSATEAEPCACPAVPEPRGSDPSCYVPIPVLLQGGCSPQTALPFHIHAHGRLIPQHYSRIPQDAQCKTQLEGERHEVRLVLSLSVQMH